MAPNERAWMSRGMAMLTAAILTGLYLALLGWLSMQGTAYDPAAVEQRIAEIKGRPAPPLAPLPVFPTPGLVPLAMARDPFRPAVEAVEIVDP